MRRVSSGVAWRSSSPDLLRAWARMVIRDDGSRELEVEELKVEDNEGVLIVEVLTFSEINGPRRMDVPHSMGKIPIMEIMGHVATVSCEKLRSGAGDRKV
jgi:hypothetical protein